MKHNRFSVIISVLLIFAMLFSACKNNNQPIGTDASESESLNESVSKSESESQSTPLESTVEAPDYSQMTMKGKVKLSNSDIGLRFFDYTVSDPCVADIEIRNSTTTLYLYNPGIYELKGTDCFGHSASFVLTVNEDFTTDVKINKCTETFIEAGQFGATGVGSDDTKYLQAAIDSANPGETVYVYPGLYRYTYLYMKEGVTLKMYNPMVDASEGYSKRIESEVNRGRATVLVGGRIMNNTKSAYGNTGSSNFTIDGGVLDMNHTYTGAIIFGHADGVTLKNIIFKDIKGNHAIQYTGCVNSSIINCMFAGYDVGDTFTREVVQIEPSTPGATGSGDNPPLKFHAGEYICPENITVDRCYFGKSDEAGAPLMAIGHHSYVGKANVTGLKITNNVFDNCLYAAIRYNNIVDTEISGNIFNATAEYNYNDIFSTKNPAFIVLYHPTADSKYTTETDGSQILRAKGSEQAGIHNLKIENNTFNIAEGSDKKVISYSALSSYKLGTSSVSGVLKQDEYNSEIYTYTGYTVNTNLAKNISFSENTINITGQPKYKDLFISLSNIYDLKFEDNKFEIADGVTFSEKYNGVYGVNISGNVNGVGARTYYFSAVPSKYVKLVDGETSSFRFIISGNAVLTFIIGEGGDIELSVDEKGNAFANIVALDGYKVLSVTDNSGNTITSGGVVSSNTTYTVNFTK